MAVEELRTRFREVVNQRDWPAVLEIGEQLHTARDFGRPLGLYAFWMEIAAGNLGRRWEAVRHSRLGLSLVEPASELEARLLSNGTYSAWLCHQPNRAIRLGSIYTDRYDRYPPSGQGQLARVLHHMAMAYQDRDDLAEAIRLHEAALVEAERHGEPGWADVIRADLAVALLRQGRSDSVDLAEGHLACLDPETLPGRARLAYLMGRAELLYRCGEFAHSLSVCDRALSCADRVSEALVRQRTEVTLLKAKGHWALGHRYEALLFGLRAALSFQGCGTRSDLDRCAIFLEAVSGTVR